MIICWNYFEFLIYRTVTPSVSSGFPDNFPVTVGVKCFPMDKTQWYAWGPFLEGPGNLMGPHSCSVFIQDDGFKSFKSCTIKLSDS